MGQKGFGKRMNPIVYFRMSDYTDEPELTVCKSIIPTVCRRTEIGSGKLVIPRYSSLPFHKELEDDVKNMGSVLINTTAQHSYLANLSYWYNDFENITPKTWFKVFDARDAKGPFVLKGSTNSKKFSWRTHMYAEDIQQAGTVASRLMEDGVIGTQDIIVREYVKLRNYGTLPCGIPLSHEFRCFFYKDQLISKAFYWSNEDVEPEDNIPDSFLKDVASRPQGQTTFWVADVAQTEAGDWIVVELNDGCMSGLSRNDPKVLYTNLANVLKEA